ncbi:hypothetical protein C4K05_2733 [Pseudomonas chlororaphis subsp. aureofaciens]|uniref:Uncharacterized protein n=1 Tax=Pseudomonas chlororaphis subsp. aureofaciens TaxID=587851 RepID=A0AAD1E5V7_9PSED|nr:hypothetical protein C4K08_2698 [Pseudomonas chlororaphis subsp. aureofaciens]AZE29418.1 hypothetical protein C4K07_2633 [Pseudomonas chlororaphis subsp. aureofaciens]AZE42073.1 hypothetical protein C4K05_2733 [Pseudomonas chlororaphis subsp. aureofaciens]
MHLDIVFYTLWTQRGNSPLRALESKRPYCLPCSPSANIPFDIPRQQGGFTHERYFFALVFCRAIRDCGSNPRPRSGSPAWASGVTWREGYAALHRRHGAGQCCLAGGRHPRSCSTGTAVRAGVHCREMARCRLYPVHRMELVVEEHRAPSSPSKALGRPGSACRRCADAEQSKSGRIFRCSVASRIRSDGAVLARSHPDYRARNRDRSHSPIGVPRYGITHQERHTVSEGNAATEQNLSWGNDGVCGLDGRFALMASAARLCKPAKPSLFAVDRLCQPSALQ